MLVLRLQLKKQLFHGHRGKDLKLFPVGLSMVLCPKTQGLFDPQRTPGSQLSHLCLTSAGGEDTALKVKFRLCHFSAVQEGRAWPHKHSQTHLTHRRTEQELGCSHQPHLPFPAPATRQHKPKLAPVNCSRQTRTWRATQLLYGASKISVFPRERAPAEVSKPTSHTTLLL